MLVYLRLAILFECVVLNSAPLYYVRHFDQYVRMAAARAVHQRAP